jgi:hypothetical protein
MQKLKSKLIAIAFVLVVTGIGTSLLFADLPPADGNCQETCVRHNDPAVCSGSPGCVQFTVDLLRSCLAACPRGQQ